jgi:hypothetical protein
MAKPHSHTQCAALVKRRTQMTPEDYETLTQALITAWAKADRAKAIVHSEGVAAHEAGNTTAQHKLEVVHHQIDKAAATLADAVHLLNNYWRG